MHVFVNPYSGEGKGCQIYNTKVAPIFQLAGITTTVTGEQNGLGTMAGPWGNVKLLTIRSVLTAYFTVSMFPGLPHKNSFIYLLSILSDDCSLQVNMLG